METQMKLYCIRKDQCFYVERVLSALRNKQGECCSGNGQSWNHKDQTKPVNLADSGEARGDDLETLS